MVEKKVYTSPKCEMYSINSQDICTFSVSMQGSTDDNEAWGDSSDEDEE